MSKRLLNIYHRMPKWIRRSAVNLHAWRLRSWRFGPETPQLVNDALERDFWSKEKWEEWKRQRLAFVLNRAATTVPYYREHWAQRRRAGDQSSWEVLENWPILEKEAVRNNPRAFIADDCDPRAMCYGHTSGTTGTPIDLWRSLSTMRTLYALATARTRGWHGVTQGDRWAKLGGQVIVPASQQEPPFWMWNSALKQLYMSSYHLSPALIPHYVEALAKYRINYLFGYTSSVFALAQEIVRQKRTDLKFKVVITEGEPLFDHQRRIISEAFGCQVAETYGMGEVLTAACECPSGTLHQWPEIGHVEVMDEAGNTTDGEFGELICTSLLNADMPLIRYRIGDRGRLNFSNSCACGRTLPSIEIAEAGSYDLLITRDGRRIMGLEDIFFQMPVRQAQIVQERLDLIRARYVPAAGFTDSSEREIVKAVQARMNGVEVVLEAVDEIPRSANGKFWLQVCKVPELIH